MSNQMTPVYSGGLMYEYSLEPNDFGIVKVNGSSVDEQPEFAKFEKALSKYPAPTGSGGASTTSNSVPCPTKDADWLVNSTLLPAIPDGAKQYFSAGAGKGPGLTGNGSQNAGGSSTGNAPPGSGSATASPTKNVAGATPGPVDKAPFYITGLVIFLTLFGTLLL
jgi:hypothetical protein